jgi:gas vesicle protein
MSTECAHPSARCWSTWPAWWRGSGPHSFTEKEGRTMADDRGSSLGAVGLAFLTGGLVGAAVALFLAPQSGRKSREQLRGYARRAEDQVHGLADKATHILDQAVDKGREFIKDTQAIVTEAVEAGRTAMEWERERLSAEKKK